MSFVGAVDNCQKYDMAVETIRQACEEEYNQPNMLLVKPINVLCLGKTRTGKTTFPLSLYNPSLCRPEEKYSETREAYMVNVCITHEGTGYLINFIDTPGLDDFSVKKDENDKKLLAIVSRFLNSEVARLHHVLVFIDDLDKANLSVLKTVLTYLGPNAKENIHIVLTKTEMWSELEVAKNLADLQKGRFEEFYLMTSGKVFRQGCVPHKYDKRPAMKREMINDIRLLHDEILMFLISPIKPLLTSEISPVVQDMLKHALDFQKAQIEDASRKGGCILS